MLRAYNSRSSYSVFTGGESDVNVQLVLTRPPMICSFHVNIIVFVAANVTGQTNKQPTISSSHTSKIQPPPPAGKAALLGRYHIARMLPTPALGTNEPTNKIKRPEAGDRQPSRSPPMRDEPRRHHLRHGANRADNIPKTEH